MPKTTATTLTAERARELLIYDPETGAFRWRTSRRKASAGAIAGSTDVDGYWQIKIDRRNYRGHRVAWLIMTGAWPPDQVDHENLIPGDNRWANLRLATRSQNQANRGRPRNNTSGAKGVRWNRRAGKWQARIHVRCRERHLGVFDDIKAAAAAYRKAAAEAHGEFARSE